MNDTSKAMYWTAAENGRVRCLICPHRCLIADGAFGICGTRGNAGGRLTARGYGRVSSIALDPIEKKPLYMFKPGKYVLSIGGYGCNLRCPFCQNHEISMNGIHVGEKGQSYTPEEIAALAIRTAPDGNIGVAYTYNEPLINYEFLYDCAALVQAVGFHNVIVTNGFINRGPLESLLPFIDAMNIDLKGFTGGFYKKIGGQLEVVMDTIALSHKLCHVEVTTLVIPGENEDDIEAIARWLSSISPDIPLHLTRFFPRYQYSGREATPGHTIQRLRETASKYLKNVFTGNM